MKNATYERVKVLIELSENLKQADEIITASYGFKTIQEKVAFLKGMFGTTIVGHEFDEPNEDTYRTLLNGIIAEQHI